jgi:hypothetical protein
MRRLLPVIVLCAVGMARHAHAQTPGLEETDIAPLADVISSMSDVEIMQMEQAVTDIVSLTPSEVSCYARCVILPIGRAEQVEQKRQNGLKG